MDLQRLLDQRAALADAFDARVADLHARPAPTPAAGTAALDALAMIDHAVQQQWQQLHAALDGAAQPARPVFRAAPAAARPQPDDVVDVSVREVPGAA